MNYYRAMLGALGPSGWWPAKSPFEVAVGAILTQNTNWTNVEKALDLLRASGGLDPAGLWRMPVEKLEEALRPSGYFRQKALRLRALLALMAKDAGQSENEGPPNDPELSFWRGYEPSELREKLLGVRGIGPETADCILLYALGHPIFVVDAYTHRIFHRHGLVEESPTYADLQAFFMDALPSDAALYNEYHALIVRIGKEFCKKSKPLCEECPLRPYLEYEPV